MIRRQQLFAAAFLLSFPWLTFSAEPLKVGYFDVDASPPIGSPLAYNPTIEVQSPLSCCGIVLLGAEKPVVLCAVDWIGIANEGHRNFCEELARAAGTSAERVAVHALHQHDAPWCDFSADQLVQDEGVTDSFFDSAFAREVLRRAVRAVEIAAAETQPVTHVGFGEGVVEQVASNRRILGADGKVKAVRFTATKDPVLQAAPEGVVDRKLKAISFWHGDTRLVELTYYATHPQSYYRTGKANPDFPGMARDQRQRETGVPHIHFNGAGGNIGAGKYNDGSQERRPILTQRMSAGMTRAWETVRRIPVTDADMKWNVVNVALPPGQHLDEQQLRAEVQNKQLPGRQRCEAASKLTWLRRCAADDSIPIACLSLGSARVLHLPGELFVEYQLAAQELRPDLFVAMAAYGDYAPWYIGTEIAYQQGGYETGPGASLVAPGVEQVLIEALAKLLDAKPDAKKLGVDAAQAEAQAADK